MAQITWKLVVTPLSGETDAREAVVQADNWLSALRLARKQLGEEGGVPPGGSCVMSASGEVTILDPAQRRRYLLTRSSESAAEGAASPAPTKSASPSLPATTAAPASSQPAVVPSPSLPAARSAAPSVAPAKAPGPTAPKPEAGPVRRATMAYSPAESAAVRAQLAAAAPPAAQQPAAAAPPAAQQPAAAAPPAVQQPAAAAPPAAQQPAAAALPAAQQSAVTDIATADTVPPAARPSATNAPTVAKPLVPAKGLSPAVAVKPLTPAQGSAAAAAIGARVPNVGKPAPGPGGAAPASDPGKAASAAASRTSPSPTGEPAPVRKTTLAYSPEESAAVRAQLLAAQQAVASAQPALPTAPGPAGQGQAPAPTPGVVSAAATQPTSAPAGERSPAPSGLPARKLSTTLAYSPEESAAARAQLLAAQKAQVEASERRPAPQPAADASPAAAPRRSATMAYVESPFIGGVLVAQGARDEEPSQSSPLSYRERTYVVAANADRARVEAALRGELERLKGELAGRPRGQFVSLAVFDHAFSDKPVRPPVATLQWKDWRGTPVYWQGSAQSAPPWSSQPGEPVRTSFVPEPSPEAPVPSAPAAPRVPHAAPAPVSPLYTPEPRTPSEARPASTSRDGTGEQDRRLAVAFEAVQDLYFLASPAEGLDFAVKLLGELVPCEAVSGCIYDINTDEFRYVAATGPGAEERRGRAVSSSVGLLSAAMHSGKESLVVADAGNDPRFDAAADGRPGLIPRNLAYLTLQKNDIWLGMLQLINRQNPRGFTDGDIAVASYLASQVLAFLLQRRGVGGRRR